MNDTDKGTEMLGHELKSVRLGGIYTLDRLASDYPDEYHILVHADTVCIRSSSTDRILEDNSTQQC